MIDSKLRKAVAGADSAIEKLPGGEPENGSMKPVLATKNKLFEKPRTCPGSITSQCSYESKQGNDRLDDGFIPMIKREREIRLCAGCCIGAAFGDLVIGGNIWTVLLAVNTVVWGWFAFWIIRHWMSGLTGFDSRKSTMSSGEK